MAQNVSESIVPATELANVQNMHIAHQATTEESSVVAKNATTPIAPIVQEVLAQLRNNLFRELFLPQNVSESIALVIELVNVQIIHFGLQAATEESLAVAKLRMISLSYQ